MTEFVGSRDAIQFGLDELLDVGADLEERFGEDIGGDLPDDGEGLEGGFFGGEGGEIGGEAAAERCEIDGLVGGVGDHADEFAGGEVMRLARIAGLTTYYRVMRELVRMGLVEYRASRNWRTGSRVRMGNR